MSAKKQPDLPLEASEKGPRKGGARPTAPHQTVEGAPVSAEIGFLDALHRAGQDERPGAGPRTAAGVVEAMLGTVADAIDDQKTTSEVRRKLLTMANDRLELLNRFLQDPTVDAQKRVNALLKALEIGIRVPAAAFEGEGKGTTIRVRVGG